MSHYRALILPVCLLLLFGSTFTVRALVSSPVQIGTNKKEEVDRRTAAQKAFSEAERLYARKGLEPLRRAIEKYEEALQFYQALYDLSGQAATLNSIGQAYDALGEKQRALDYYDQALPLWISLADQHGQALTLNNIGKNYIWLGDRYRALDLLQQALKLRIALGDRSDQATTLTNLGVVYDWLGEKQKSLDNYNKALSLLSVNDRSGRANTLYNFGLLYESLGERRKGISYYKKSLSLYIATNDLNGQALALTAIGEFYKTQGEFEKALNYFKSALPLRIAVGDRYGEAIGLRYIGSAYDSLGERQKALDYLNRSLPLHMELGNISGKATILVRLGMLYNSEGEKQKALDLYNEALALRKSVADRFGQTSILYRIARIHYDLGNLQIARENIEDGLRLTEQIRSGISSEQLRSSFFAITRNYYELYISLLMKMHQADRSAGFDSIAFRMSEQARARSLLDLLTEARAAISRDVDVQLLDEERGLRQKLSDKFESLISVRINKPEKDKITEAEEDIERLKNRLDEVKREIRVKSPRYASLTEPQALTLKEIQSQVLDPDTLLLEYTLGEESSHLWLVSSNSLESFSLPKRTVIEDAARRVYQFIAGFNENSKTRKAEQEYSKAAADLSRMILGPVAERLGKKRLFIVAEGALQYLPFSALPIPEVTGQSRIDNPLIVDHEVINIPSASILAVQRRELAGRKSAPKKIMVVADPVFERSDPRVMRILAGCKPKTSRPEVVDDENKQEITAVRSAQKSGVIGSTLLPRLIFTRQEAAEIKELTSQEESRIVLDFEASRSNVLGEDLNQYRIIHFATHGLLNSTTPELSGIMLSLINEKGEKQRGFLGLQDIYNLRLSADLVVLSACQTGLGKEIRGEGMVGLTRGFMYAGASSILASLWKVDDSVTAELMKEFYQAILGPQHLSPSSAIRIAQLSIMKKRGNNSPYYWAAFQLQGEWH